MTVPSNINKWNYDGNDVDTSFPYTRKIFNSSDLFVILTDTNGDDTTLVEGTDYSVSNAGNVNGGAVAYPLSGDPLATGESLTLLRVVALTQDTSFKNQGAFFPESHEDSFDRSMMVDQQQQTEIERSFKIPSSFDSAFDPVVKPVPGAYLRFTINGLETTNLTVNSVNPTTHTYFLEYTSGGIGVGLTGTSIETQFGITLIAGDLIFTDQFDSNRVAGSGARLQFTGTTIPGNSGTTPGYVYDADGKQFENVSDSKTLSQWGFTDDLLTATDDRGTLINSVFLAVSLSSNRVITWDVNVNASYVEHPESLWVIFINSKGLQMPSGFDATENAGYRPASDIAYGRVTNLTIDGNATRAQQYNVTNNWQDGFSGGNFTKGAFHAHGLFLVPETTVGWVAPDVFIVDGYSYIHDTVRDCVIYHTGAGRSDKGAIYNNGLLHLKNSHVDHLIYESDPSEGDLGDVLLEGYADFGYIVELGTPIKSIIIINPELNPDSNAAESFEFNTKYIGDNRGGGKGSQIGLCTYTGDLATLDGSAADIRQGWRFNAVGANVELSIQHTGVDTEFVVWGTRDTEGLTAIFTGFSMPESTILHRGDIEDNGDFIRGAHFITKRIEWRAGASAIAQALIDYGSTVGQTVSEVLYEGGYIYADSFGEAGPTSLLNIGAATGAYSDIVIKGLTIPSTDNATYPVSINSGVTALRIYLDAVTTNNSRPAGGQLGRYSIRNECSFAGRNYYAFSNKLFSPVTSDATVTPIWVSSGISADSAIFIRCTGFCISTSGSRRAYFDYLFPVARPGGSAVSDGVISRISPVHVGAPVSVDITLSLAGTNATINVTGEVGVQYNWQVSISVIEAGEN